MPTKTSIRFGEAVRDYRRNSGLTLPKLAELTGLSKGLISKIESGAGNPSLTTIHKLAHALRVGVTELVS